MSSLEISHSACLLNFPLTIILNPTIDIIKPITANIDVIGNISLTDPVIAEPKGIAQQLITLINEPTLPNMLWSVLDMIFVISGDDSIGMISPKMKKIPIAIVLLR